MDTTFITIISILIIYVLIMSILLCNNYLYNAICNRKERKTWKFVIRNVDKFNYIGTNELNKKFRWNDYIAIIWNDNTCSIHVITPTRHKCLGTHLDKVMSNRMRDLLLTKIR